MATAGDWDDLRFYLAIARAGSLAAAARALGVDQSTVSRRLAALEESLGARLFERAADGLRPTAAGQAIRQKAEEAEAAISGLGILAASASGVKGEVHIETSPIFAEYFLGPRLPRLAARFPDLTLTLTTGRQLISLQRHEADVALRQLPAGVAPGSASVLAQKIGEFPFAPYASPAYLEGRGLPKLPFGEEQPFELVDLRSPRGGSVGQTWVSSFSHAPRVVLTAGDLGVLVTAVQAGLGVGLMPCLVANVVGGVARVGPVVERFLNWVAMPTEARHDPRVRAVKDAVVELVQEDRALFEPVIAP